MKLTQERVEGLHRTILHGLTCKPQSLTDLCEDNLAMRKMLEELEWCVVETATRFSCPRCSGDEPNHLGNCELKELLK